MIEDEPNIIIYGLHSIDWMSALDPRAVVWEGVKSAQGAAANVRLIEQFPPDYCLPSDNLTIIPLMERHILSCPIGFRALIPSVEAVATLANKRSFAQFMNDYGFSSLCPQTFFSVKEISYPCVLKRIDLNAGNGIIYVEDESSLIEALDTDIFRGHEVIFQSYVAGAKEMVTHIVAKNGRIHYSASYEYGDEANENIRGGSLSERSMKPYDADEKTLDYFEQILSKLQYSGPCNIDYKVNSDGVISIFEINPRLGGSLMNPQHLSALRETLIKIIALAE